MECLISLLQQSFQGNELEIREAENFFLDHGSSPDFCEKLFTILLNENEISFEIRCAALIWITHLVRQFWLNSYDENLKNTFLDFYYLLLYGNGYKYGKLFQHFSDLIIEATMELNEIPNIPQQFFSNNQSLMGSLILSKSITYHFKNHNETDNISFYNFISMLIEKEVPFFNETNDLNLISIMFKIFHYIIIYNITDIFINNNNFLLKEIFLKFFQLGSFQSVEEYQSCIKSGIKVIHLLINKFESSKSNSDLKCIQEHFIIKTFEISLNLFQNEIHPSLRDEITRLINRLFDFRIIIQLLLQESDEPNYNNIYFFFEKILLPFFCQNDVKRIIYQKIICIYEPLESSIFLIQSLVCKYNIIKEYINTYLINSLNHILKIINHENEYQNELKLEFSRVHLAVSSLCVYNSTAIDQFLQICFNSNIEYNLIVALTITANMNTTSFPFEFLLNLTNSEIPLVKYLSGFSILKALKNIYWDEFPKIYHFLPQLFNIYLSISDDISSIKYLKRLLIILSSYLDYLVQNNILTNFSFFDFFFRSLLMIISLLFSQLMFISNEEFIDGHKAHKVAHRICQIAQIFDFFLNVSQNNFVNFSQNFDFLITELINSYIQFNDFFKEIILNILETFTNYFLSPTFWNIISIFQYNIFFEEEMNIFNNIMVLSNFNTIINICMIQSVLCNLFLKLNNPDSDFDIALDTIGNILIFLGSCSFETNNERNDLMNNIYTNIFEILKMKIDSPFCISRLISNIIISQHLININVFSLDEFFTQWLTYGEFPHFCSAANLIIPCLMHNNIELSLKIVIKECDILNSLTDYNAFSEKIQFHIFETKEIILSFLKVIKQIQNENSKLYSQILQSADYFLKEKIPLIVDKILESE